MSAPSSARLRGVPSAQQPDLAQYTPPDGIYSWALWFVMSPDDVIVQTSEATLKYLELPLDGVVGRPIHVRGSVGIAGARLAGAMPGTCAGRSTVPGSPACACCLHVAHSLHCPAASMLLHEL